MTDQKQDIQDIVERVLYNTRDHTEDLLALTTLLHHVCDNEPDRFEEATRIVKLFIERTVEEMQSLVALECDDEPGIMDPGFIIAEITHIYTPEERPHSWLCYEFGELTGGGSAFWIQEGEGYDHWLSSIYPDEITEPGWWIITGIKGVCYRGDGWLTDDDVEWEYETIRRATEDEIDTLDWIKT